MKPPMAPATADPRLRGHYDEAREDYTVDQRHGAYTPGEHRLWAELLRRQSALLPRYANQAFIDGLESLQLADRVPDLERCSDLLQARTGWRLVGVPGLIPEGFFFEHLASRRFPVTVWLRTPGEIDYLSEPDLFHDFFGHVPLLTDPAYAGFIELYGRAGKRALDLGGLGMLARLYWYTIEFGLIETDAGLRCYGAGILSSRGETVYALDSPRPHRLRFDLERVLRTEYLIDDFQRNYFVVRSFDDLVRCAVDTDFAPLYRAWAHLPGIPAGQLLAQDAVLHRGATAP